MLYRRLVAFFLCLWFVPFVLAASAPGFEVNNVLIKASLHKGETIDKYISVRAGATSHFDASVTGVPGVGLDASSFEALAGETVNIRLRFSTDISLPDAYIGALHLVSGHSDSTIPIILEVESLDPTFDISLDVPPEYKEITPQDKLVAIVKLFDLTSGGTAAGLGPTHVALDYSIYDFSGKQVSSQSEDVIIDRQTQLTKSFSFPSDLAAGDYVLVVKVAHGSSIGLASSVFSIGKSSSGLFLSPGLVGGSLVYILLIALVFLVFFLGLFVYFVKDRDKLILELKEHNANESSHVQHFLAEQSKLLEDKGVAKKEVAQEVAQKLGEVRKRHAVREHELKKLKSEGNLDAMHKKLAQWKREGYDTTLLDYKLKGLSTGDMQTLLSKWKHQYRRRV